MISDLAASSSLGGVGVIGEPMPSSSSAAPANQHAEMNGLPAAEEEPLPTYADAFPPLMVGAGGPARGGHPHPGATPKNTWANHKFSVKRSTVTQVFCVPVEERKFKDKDPQNFGEQEQAKICQDIMSKTGVTIEVSSAKDKSLTVVINGKGDAVMQARKMIVQQLQTQARATLKIPREHFGYILGPKGKKLMDLELDTATKINIPRPNDINQEIMIIGNREGIEKARHEIQLISDEQSKLAFERLIIEKIYHPFIQGPDQQTARQLSERTGAKISIPPPSVMKDEVVVSGEKEGVHQAIAEIERIYREKKEKCQTVSVEVRKTQHKYLIGQRGSGLNEILAQTGVSVEVPPTDSQSETITLRGEQQSLGSALTLVYAKANSVVIDQVDAPAWIHRFIIGKKGAGIKQITQEFDKVHIEFQDGQDKIELEGPPGDVNSAKQALEAVTKDLLSRMAFTELNVDPKFHKHIIGKAGSNVGRIKDETGVNIRIPPDSENSSIIRIEGSPEGVATAKKELVEMVHKMENEKTRDIMLEHRFHKTLIGAQGASIREIRDKFNQVQVTFPDSGKRSDVVTLRGQKNDVDRCYRYLQQLHIDMVAHNYMAEVKIFKYFHKNIIGKGGTTIRKIRDETDTKIDLPSEASESDMIQITGLRANVEKAREQIEQIQKELANIKEVTIEIPNKFHNAIIGAKGRLIKSVMDECGGVLIRFPTEGSNDDKVCIRGPEDDVEKAKKQLVQLANERKEQGHTAEIKCKPEYHSFLIGRGGGKIRELRESTGARVIFPASNDADADVVTIMGTKEAVEKAKDLLSKRISDLENVTEKVINVETKHHRYFVIRRGEQLRQIAEEFGGVTVSFPKIGVNSDVVVIKGSADCVAGAAKRILDIVDDLDSQVTINCVILQVHHRNVMGSKGSKVQQITQQFDVQIKFPDRPSPPANNPTVNGDGDVNGSEEIENGDDVKPRKMDTIVISGKKEKCEAAAAALQALVPIERQVTVPTDYHKFIIGQGGKDVRKMMGDYDVNISIPASQSGSDIITIKGAAENVSEAERALIEKTGQLDEEKVDREARQHRIEVEVDPVHHPKIIGRRGMIISKIRKDHGVQIQLPERDAECDDVITITGYEAKACAARDEILAIVKELEDQVSEEVKIDPRVHPRIIGGRGRNVRKLMEEHKVDIKFPRADAADNSLIIISGDEDNVLDCKDKLLLLEEEFLQDIVEEEAMKAYVKPTKEKPKSTDNPRGFMVRDAPWNLDTSNTEDFPAFGAHAGSKSQGPSVWAQRR